MNDLEMLHSLQNNHYIREKEVDGNIHSFNFTRKAFYKGVWDEQTITARGLFVNVDTGKVFARSYNKFFNIDEREETLYHNLKKNLNYPVRAFRKENGYLGILSVDEDGVPHYFSKSTGEGPFAENFKRIAEEKNILPAGFFNFLRMTDSSAVFEVIDVENDRHFVDYEESTIVLLDLIYNKYDFFSMNYSTVKLMAEDYAIPVKTLVKEIQNPEELESFIECAEKENDIEGYVLEDSSHFMFKLKTDWYKFWKATRNAGHKIYHDSWAWTMMDISTPRGIVVHEDFQLCGEALQYYAFARESGYPMPHIMDVRRCLKKYSRLDHPYLV